MEQLEILKNQIGDPTVDEDVLEFCLDSAGEIIMEIRNADKVEKKYHNTQIAMAIEIFNRMGAEGQRSHTEGDISRVYERADISSSLLSRITPMVKTPFSKIRVIEE